MNESGQRTRLSVGFLFATPLAESRMPEPEGTSLTSELRELFLARAGEGARYANEVRRDTQHGELFESRFDLFKWPDEPVRRLTRFVHGALTGLIAQLTDYAPEELERLVFDYHAWFHVTRTGGYQALHNHQNASWSGIFCVDPGDEVPERPDSGAVRFYDPRMMSFMYMDAGNRRLKNPANHGAWQIRHERGKLLLFPSYVAHEIFPYLGERPRIIVAFNSWVRLEPATKGNGSQPAR